MCATIATTMHNISIWCILMLSFYHYIPMLLFCLLAFWGLLHRAFTQKSTTILVHLRATIKFVDVQVGVSHLFDFTARAEAHYDAHDFLGVLSKLNKVLSCWFIASCHSISYIIAVIVMCCDRSNSRCSWMLTAEGHDLQKPTQLLGDLPTLDKLARKYTKEQRLRFKALREERSQAARKK